MGYDRTIGGAAAGELERRRKTAEATAARRLEEFYRQCPKAQEIKSQMASNAAKAGRAVVAGGNVRAELEKLRDTGLALTQEYQELLAAHGLTAEDVTPRYTCPHCKDTGFVDGRMCGCLRQLRKNAAYQQLSSGLPLEKCTFQNFSLEFYQENDRTSHQMESVLRACKSYAQRLRENSPSLLFKGGTGLGKTHLSLAIANCAIEKGLGVIYGSAQTFATALEKERFDREGQGVAEKLADCDLLILDDLGAEFPSAYVNAALYDTVNRRMLADRPTIISTNLSMKELEERYGERFASRVAGYYGKLEFIGSDVRVQQQRNRTRRSQN